jgi:hypothetical protein
MAYEYDIFLSYNRKYPHGEWVNEIFYPLFKSYVDEALNKDVRIFKDAQEIQTGNDWRLKIRNALIKSKVMVSIFSPSYFRSEWCMREFSAIYYRQKSLGFLTLQNPTGLIVPIKIFDGEHFPEYANELQILNCIEFNRVGPGVKNTNLYIDLQGKLQDWVSDVAAAFDKAPDFDSQWMNEDWVEKAFRALSIEELPTVINPPTL